MQIKQIASGSKGNALLVGDGETQILLDAGISYKKIARQVRPTSLAGVLITHEHSDHAKAVSELSRRGVDVFMSLGTAKALDVPDFGAIVLRHLKQIEIDSWIVLPFNVIHDAEEPLGFLLQSKATGEKLVYIVDSGYVQYDFNGVTHWLIEANYSEELLESGPYEEYLKDRVRRNHFSLEDLKVFFRTSDMSQTEEIHLLHLSDHNSDEQQFKEEIQKLTGCPTYTITDFPGTSNSAVPTSVPVGRT